MKELDIPCIKEILKEKHDLFIKETGTLSNKVSDDHVLVLTKLTSKIGRVLQEFCSAKVIDAYDNIKTSSYYGFILDDRYINGIILSKVGYSSKIIIWTDGRTIMFQSSGLPFNGIEDIKIAAMRNVIADNFDGKEFADKLLNYIHQVIYFRKEAYDQKLKEILRKK